MPSAFLFSYPNTTTEPLDFSQVIQNSNYLSDAPSKDQISKLNDIRSRMASLFLSQPNTKAVLDIINEYIPKLIEILPFIENHKLQNIAKIKWRSALSASVRTSLSGSFEKPLVKSYSIYYEIIYAHMAYAFTLSNMAIKRSSGDASDETLNECINDLCKAAGIFQNLSVTYSSTWAIQDGPPETTSDSLIALSELALGDAQQLTCIKAERKGLSLGTLHKLKAGVVAKYEKCFKMFSKNAHDYEDVSKQFKSHIVYVRKFIEGSMLLSMAKTHADNEEYGAAVVEITAAHNLLVDCNEAENSSIKIAARELVGEASSLHSKYTKINNSVCYQRVPDFIAHRAEYIDNCKVIVDAKPVVFNGGNQI